MAKWWQDEGAKREYQQLMEEAKRRERRGDKDGAASSRYYADWVVDSAKRRARER